MGKYTGTNNDDRFSAYKEKYGLFGLRKKWKTWIIEGLHGDDSLTGGPLADKILGSDGMDTLSGLDGDDSIKGGKGIDFILGGAGDDTLEGEQDSDLINGGAGEDLIFDYLGSNYLLGESGDDTISGGSNQDTIDGGRDNDLLIGNGGDDIIHGQNGKDTIEGGSGHDFLTGGAGNDILNGGPGNDTLIGGASGAADDLTGGVGEGIFLLSSKSGISGILDFDYTEDKIHINQSAYGINSLDDLSYDRRYGILRTDEQPIARVRPTSSFLISYDVVLI